MVDYREILRLHNLGYSQRVITSSVHSSRSTVKEVIDLANALKIEWPLDANVTNSDLELLLYPARAEKNSNRMPIDFPWIHRELAKKGVTMTLLWCFLASNFPHFHRYDSLKSALYIHAFCGA